MTKPLENPMAMQNQSGLQWVDSFVSIAAIGRHTIDVIFSLKNMKYIILKNTKKKKIIIIIIFFNNYIKNVKQI